jgi:hypothetical protein
VLDASVKEAKKWQAGVDSSRSFLPAMRHTGKNRSAFEHNCQGFNAVTEVIKRGALGVELHVC